MICGRVARGVLHPKQRGLILAFRNIIAFRSHDNKLKEIHIVCARAHVRRSCSHHG